MSDESSSHLESEAEHLHHDHSRAQNDHQTWIGDIERWRDEYRKAIGEFARRMNPDLDFDAYEASVEAHESALGIAIAIHEQAVDRHERALGLEARGSKGASEGFEEIHLEFDVRHRKSRKEHERLARRHARIVATLTGAETPDGGAD